MSTVEIYNLDITGEAPENAIVNEAHPIGQKKVFIAKAGAFYTKSLVVTQGGQIKHRGLDWQPIVFNQKASLQVGNEIHTGIVMSNMESTDPIIISYQCVGGEYARYQEAILELIEALGLETSMVQYGDLIGVPDVFAPAPHKTDAEDLIGMSRVVEMLARLEDALSTKQINTIKALAEQVSNKVDKGGQQSVKPDGGSMALGVNDLMTDITLPRSEQQNSSVMLELLFTSNGAPYKAVISYVEVQDGVTNIQGFYMGPSKLDTRLNIGVRAGNGLTSLFRIAAIENGGMQIDNLHVSSMVTSDNTLNKLYGKVAKLDTPSMLEFQLQELIPSSGDVTTTIIENITNNYTNLERRVVNTEDGIQKLNLAVDNAKDF